MAKEVVAWCDPCLADDVRTPAHTVGPISLGTGKPFTVDVCAEHDKSLVEPLRHLLAEHGQTVNQPNWTTPPSPRKSATGNSQEELLAAAANGTRRGMPPTGPRAWPCLLCPLDYAAPSGYRQHLKKAHGVADASLREVFGRACPVCGRGGWENLSQHLSTSHPEVGPNIAAVFHDLRESDPHGVVAERLAAIKA